LKLTIQKLSFVVLIGVSGSGKSTFARKHFKPTEILSSDFCRGLVSDDENSQAATRMPFELLHFIARSGCGGQSDVVDATTCNRNRASHSWKSPASSIACRGIVLDVPERVAHDRTRRGRP